MGLGFRYGTDWVYETSQDFTVSVVASVSAGILKFRNQQDNSSLSVKYHCISIGAGKGLPVNVSNSMYSDPSGGYGTIQSDKYFDDFCFPCHGYMFGAGGSWGALSNAPDPSQSQTAGNYTIVLFGIWPVFAGIRLWGTGFCLLPGIGLSGGIASFEIADPGS